MRITPAPGLKVRDPLSKRHIPDEGVEVQESSYWVRRLAAGEVVKMPDPVVQEDHPSLPSEEA